MHATQPDESDIQSLTLRTVSAINKLLKFHEPSHIVLVWDGSEESWRKRLFADYKKGRKPMPESLASGLPSLKNTLSENNWHNLDAESEADDVIATLATKLTSSGGEAIIVSTDNGFTQLLHPNIKQWDHFSQQYLDINALEQKFGVERAQFVEYWSLAGATGNKIPGVTGIGPKSAAELLKVFRSITNIYASLDAIGDKQAKKLAEGKEMAKLSYKLVQLQCNMPLNLSLSAFRYAGNK